MNLGEIRTEVLDIVATTSDDKLLTTAVVNRFINRALQAIAAHREWSWLNAETSFATVASTATYALPSDHMRTLSVTNADNVALLYLESGQIDQADEIESDEPVYFTVINGLIELSPTPGAAYTLRHRYLRREPSLINETDTPLLPVHYHSAITEYAAALCFRRQRNEQAASTAMDAYRAILDDAIDQPTQTNQSGRIKTRAGGWL
jgi:hypothetical protein